MATKNTAAVEQPKYAKVHIPRATNGESNFITASLNGKTYQIQRGIDVKVPVGVAEIIVNSYTAENAAIAYIEGKKED